MERTVCVLECHAVVLVWVPHGRGGWEGHCCGPPEGWDLGTRPASMCEVPSLLIECCLLGGDNMLGGGIL